MTRPLTSLVVKKFVCGRGISRMTFLVDSSLAPFCNLFPPEQCCCYCAAVAAATIAAIYCHMKTFVRRRSLFIYALFLIDAHLLHFLCQTPRRREAKQNITNINKPKRNTKYYQKKMRGKEKRRYRRSGERLLAFFPLKIKTNKKWGRHEERIRIFQPALS